MYGYSNNADMPIYYVYAWYYVDTGEIFYIGKGKNNRYKERKVHRNQFFKNILAKHKENVDAKILESNMTESVALAREKQLISEYWKIGQCKANLHEGGCGGNTGNYNNPERSRKLSESAKKRTGSKNSMYGRTHSADARLKISQANIGKHLTEEHIRKLIAVNTGRIKTESELRKLSLANKGRKHSKMQTLHNKQSQSKNIYEVFYRGSMIYRCVNQETLVVFCRKFLHISRTILPNIIARSYVPKFNRHKWITELTIIETDKTAYRDWQKIFSESMEDYVNKQTVFNLEKYITDLNFQAKINRYGKKINK